MRVLVVSDTYSRMRGGVPEETRRLANGLVARGHEVALCADEPLAGVAEVAHFAITLPSGERLGDEVGAALAAFRPDLIHVMAMSSRGVLALQGVLDPHPWLLTCHSLPPHERKLPALHASEPLHYGARAARFLPHALAWRWLLRRGVVPHVVVHSPWMARLIERYGQPRAATSMILLGAEAIARTGPLPLPRMQPTAPHILTIAGIAHTKGYHDALRALAEVRERFPAATYRIVGEIRDPSYMRHLDTLIDRFRLRDAVRITPNLSDDDKERALAACDLYLQPSHEEGFCLAYVEAAERVPRLVGCDTGAIAIVSEGDVGARVVPPRRPGALAGAMLDVLAQPLPAELLRTRAERLRRTLDWSIYLDAHEALYARVRRDRDRDRERTGRHG